MRIAFSGSHRVGKSTLIERVSDALPQYEVVDEPYHLLEEDGYDFSSPPSAGDFLAQFDRSVVELERAHHDVLFDRCPVDFLAYLVVLGREVVALVERARSAMRVLDLVVFVPIEEPDRLALSASVASSGESSASADLEQRQAVDEMVQRLLFDEDFGVEVVTVSGSVQERVRQALEHVDE